MLTPPEAFGCVEEGIYRCVNLEDINAQFLYTLKLRMILSLNPYKPSKAARHLAQTNNIELVHLGTQPWRSSAEWLMLSKDIIQDTLTYILDKRNHPLLLIDSSNAFIGVLRQIQHWTYSSIVAEFRAFTAGKSHYHTEIFLELLVVQCISHEEAVKRRKSTEDSPRIPTPATIQKQQTPSDRKRIVVHLPPDEVLPEWLKRQNTLWKEEENELEKKKAMEYI